MHESLAICCDTDCQSMSITICSYGLHVITISQIYELSIETRMLKSQEDTEAFIERVKVAYYGPLVAAGRIKGDDWSDILFASKPASGGAILKLAL